MKSIISSLEGTHGGFVLLAPHESEIPPFFRHVAVDIRSHGELLVEMQRFRGRVYLDDGAILPHQLSSDGRHAVKADDDGWHLLKLNREQRVCGCVRILERTDMRNFDELTIRNCALARSAPWSRRLREAVELEMALARRERLWFAEIGGLAMAAERRCTTDSLRTILATFGFLQLFGGAKCVATVTTRHGCAPILRRIGLSPLILGGVELPSYYDPQYGCEMEVLHFDSRFPNPKYLNWIGELSSYLRAAPLISAKRAPDAKPAPRTVEWPLLYPVGVELGHHLTGPSVAQ